MLDGAVWAKVEFTVRAATQEWSAFGLPLFTPAALPALAPVDERLQDVVAWAPNGDGIGSPVLNTYRLWSLRLPPRRQCLLGSRFKWRQPLLFCCQHWAFIAPMPILWEAPADAAHP